MMGAVATLVSGQPLHFNDRLGAYGVRKACRGLLGKLRDLRLRLSILRVRMA